MRKRIVLALILCLMAAMLSACAIDKPLLRQFGAFIQRTLTHPSGTDSEGSVPISTAVPGLELPEIIIPISTAPPAAQDETPAPSPTPTNGDFQFPRL